MPHRKAFFLLCHLVRLYVGPGLDFDVQLVLKADEVPEYRLGDESGVGARLGWNVWVRSRPLGRDPDDAAFEAEEVSAVDPDRRRPGVRRGRTTHAAWFSRGAQGEGVVRWIGERHTSAVERSRRL